MSNMLKNVSALITGGAQGMGRAFAESILQHGAKVSILDIDAGKGSDIENKFSKCYGRNNFLFLKCDVTDSSELREGFLKTYHSFNGINLLVNNAGIATFYEEHWRSTLNVNLVALIECCYLGREFMSKSSCDNFYGHIVNVASAGGLTGMAVDPVYSASKHGVVGLSRSLAERWAPHKIRVNCLCPMFVDTELFKTASELNEEYANTLEGLPLLKVSDVVEVFDDLLKKNTSGEILHISASGTKTINKKIINLGP